MISTIISAAAARLSIAVVNTNVLVPTLPLRISASPPPVIVSLKAVPVRVSAEAEPVRVVLLALAEALILLLLMLTAEDETSNLVAASLAMSAP